VNILDNNGASPVHRAVLGLWDNIEGLKLLLKHPGLSALTLNKKDEEYCKTPVMLAVSLYKLEFVALLAADLRVDLDDIKSGGVYKADKGAKKTGVKGFAGRPL